MTSAYRPDVNKVQCLGQSYGSVLITLGSGTMSWALSVVSFPSLWKHMKRLKSESLYHRYRHITCDY